MTLSHSECRRERTAARAHENVGCFTTPVSSFGGATRWAEKLFAASFLVVQKVTPLSRVLLLLVVLAQQDCERNRRYV